MRAALPMTSCKNLCAAAAVLAASLCLSGVAAAQDQPASSGDTAWSTADAAPASASAGPVGDLVEAAHTTAPAPGEAAIALPSPTMTAGASLHFSLVSTEERHGGGHDSVRTNRQAIELQVRPKTGKRRVLRYIIRSGEIDNDPLAMSMLTASRDLATDYEADPTGRPLRLMDWEGVRGAMLKRLITDPAAPVAGVQHIQQLLGGMDAVNAIPFAIPETLMMADMQGWPPLATGRHDDAAGLVAAGQARLVSFRQVGEVDKAACTVRLTRSTALDPASGGAQGASQAQSLLTVADVSTVDGWVVRLTQSRTQPSATGTEVRTWVLTRDDPPACKG